jgi:thiol-disulfide isomerase/thioredoxin
LDFWATWCAPCQAAMPDLVSVHEEFADRNVRVLSVNLGEDRKRVAAFMKRREYDLHVLLDHDGAVGDAYGVRGIPTIVIVDKQGVVRRIYVGGTSKSSLDKYLTELAGE